MERYLLLKKHLQSKNIILRIIDYSFNKKCLSCGNLVTNSFINPNYNKYWDTDWKINRCFKLDNVSVCNWCYYYVWEYQ